MGDMPDSRPHWSSQTKLVVSLLLLAALLVFLYSFRIAIPPLILALILAYILAPLVNLLQNRFGIHRAVATALVYLGVALALVLQETFGWSLDDLELARRCQRAEIRFVGMQCGIMDQAASLLSRFDHALCLDTRSLSVRYARIGLPEVVWLVVQSGIRRELTSSDYNRRREECERAALWLRENLGRPIVALPVEKTKLV